MTNTQLGQEEQSAGLRLVVRGSGGVVESDAGGGGGGGGGASGQAAGDVPVSIVVAPAPTSVVRGTPVTELHCIANARLPPIFTCIDLILLGFTWFYWILPSFTGFLPSFTEFYRVLYLLTWYYLVIMGFTAFYWVLSSFTEFYRVLYVLT